MRTYIVYTYDLVQNKHYVDAECASDILDLIDAGEFDEDAVDNEPVEFGVQEPGIEIAYGRCPVCNQLTTAEEGDAGSIMTTVCLHDSTLKDWDERNPN